MFHRCKDKEDGHKLFKKLAKYLHPDTGGDHESFILLKECFDMFLDYLTSGFHENTEKKGDPNRYQLSPYDVTEGSDKLKIFDEITKYSKTHLKYNLSYLESVQEYLQEHGFITSGQYNALVKNYYAFRMDKEPMEENEI